jgi:CRP-like cAMP-binding protein
LKQNLPAKQDMCETCPSKDKGIFCDLAHNELNELDQHKVTNIFKKGQTLFVEGSPPYGVYCITSGNIKISKSSTNGRDAIVRFASPGDIVGHRSIFSNQNYSATATALEDTSVCFIDKKYIIALVQENPSVAYNLMSKLGQDLGASESKVASFSQKNVLERTCELLLLLEQSHGDYEEAQDRTRLNITLTREEFAAAVGTAPETLIRIFSDLKKDEIIEQEKKVIFIKNHDKLLELAGLNF